MRLRQELMDMPRYTFAINDGKSQPDEIEIDLIDIAEAKAQAIRTAGEVLADIGCGSIWDGVPWQLIVKDENHLNVLDIKFVIRG